MSYFGEFDDVTEPSKQHLVSFLQQSKSFLLDVIRNRLVDFGRVDDLDLCNAEMRVQAEALIYDRNCGFEIIIEAVNLLPGDSNALAKHGLVGPSQRARLSAIARLESRVGFFRTEEIIKKILEEIDAVLDSTCGALESASKECGPAASRYQSAYIDVEMGIIIYEIKKMVESLLHNVRLAGRPVANKVKPTLAGQRLM